MSDKELATCPCGRRPDELGITDAGQGSKFANVSGSCCGEWMTEFFTRYEALNSEKCMALAIDAWNNAPRVENQEVKDLIVERDAALADAKRLEWVLSNARRDCRQKTQGLREYTKLQTHKPPPHPID